MKKTERALSHDILSKCPAPDVNSRDMCANYANGDQIVIERKANVILGMLEGQNAAKNAT